MFCMEPPNGLADGAFAPPAVGFYDHLDAVLTGSGNHGTFLFLFNGSGDDVLNSELCDLNVGHFKQLHNVCSSFLETILQRQMPYTIK